MSHSSPLRAILVCVEYSDLLSITLPYNRHHFTDVMVVTSTTDRETIRVARDNDAKVHVTDLFYTDGAIFNKWRALEEGLDVFGREGLLCIMDADVVWPKQIDHYQFPWGCLTVPRRHLFVDVTEPLPLEKDWYHYPTMNEVEFAGYSQIFHANDPHLPPAPWHQTDWTHAGGADSFFQQLWPSHCKLRTDWQVMHLGPPGINWLGRASQRVDGTSPEDAGTKRWAMRKMRTARQYNARQGDPYRAERIRTEPSHPGKPFQA